MSPKRSFPVVFFDVSENAFFVRMPGNKKKEEKKELKQSHDSGYKVIYDPEIKVYHENKTAFLSYSILTQKDKERN